MIRQRPETSQVARRALQLHLDAAQKGCLLATEQIARTIGVAPTQVKHSLAHFVVEGILEEVSCYDGEVKAKMAKTDGSKRLRLSELGANLYSDKFVFGGKMPEKETWDVSVARLEEEAPGVLSAFFGPCNGREGAVGFACYAKKSNGASQLLVDANMVATWYSQGVVPKGLYLGMDNPSVALRALQLGALSIDTDAKWADLVTQPLGVCVSTEPELKARVLLGQGFLFGEWNGKGRPEKKWLPVLPSWEPRGKMPSLHDLTLRFHAAFLIGCAPLIAKRARSPVMDGGEE